MTRAFKRGATRTVSDIKGSIPLGATVAIIALAFVLALLVATEVKL